MHKQEKLIVTRTKNRKQRNSVDYRIIQKIEHVQILPKFREYFFLFCSYPSFMLFRCSLFLTSCRDTWKLNKVEVGNLSKLLFLLCADPFFIIQLPTLTTFEICSKLNSLCEFFPPITFFVAKNFFSFSLLSNNILVPTNNNLFVPTKIKLLIIKLIWNVMWKTCWDFLTAI